MLDCQGYDIGRECTPETSVQDAPEKAMPRTAREWFKAIGPRVSEAIKPFQCGAPWTAFANDIELRRLARIQARIERKKIGMAELTAERGQIMRRCVRRMRRHRGLDL